MLEVVDFVVVVMEMTIFVFFVLFSFLGRGSDSDVRTFHHLTTRTTREGANGRAPRARVDGPLHFEVSYNDTTHTVVLDNNDGQLLELKLVLEGKTGVACEVRAHSRKDAARARASVHEHSELKAPRLVYRFWFSHRGFSLV